MKIVYNKLLDDIFLAHTRTYADYKDINLQSQKYLQNKLRDYSKWFSESKIEKKIEKVTGYKFESNIKIYMVAVAIRDVSEPIIIKSRYNKQDFLEAVCHELCHRILVDNKHERESHADKTVANHIEVYRIMIKTLGKIKKPNNLKYLEAYNIARS